MFDLLKTPVFLAFHIITNCLNHYYFLEKNFQSILKSFNILSYSVTKLIELWGQVIDKIRIKNKLKSTFQYYR